jgi:hypothetical protein
MADYDEGKGLITGFFGGVALVLTAQAATGMLPALFWYLSYLAWTEKKAKTKTRRGIEIVVVAALLVCLATGSQADVEGSRTEEYTHWPIKVTHVATYVAQGEHIVLQLSGWAPNNVSHYEKVMIDTNLGRRETEIGETFGGSNSTSAIRFTFSRYRGGPSSAFADPDAKSIIINQVLGLPPGRLMEDITSDLEVVPFIPMPIIIKDK